MEAEGSSETSVTSYIQNSEDRNPNGIEREQLRLPNKLV
jgi:hypothetical protein